MSGEVFHGDNLDVPREQNLTLAGLVHGKRLDVPYVDVASAKHAKRNVVGRQERSI